MSDEIDRLRDGNANLIRNAEILADELIHATAECDELRGRIAALEAERDRIKARLEEEMHAHSATWVRMEGVEVERDRMRPVVEAARAFAHQGGGVGDRREPAERLLAAVDAFESGPHNTGSEVADG